MKTTALSLGYIILFVKDVQASLGFYEKAFGFSRRFFNDEGGNAYGELESGPARIAFCNLQLARSAVKRDFQPAAPDQPPPGFEIALLAADVPAAFAYAVKSGARPVSEPEVKPWGQTVACVRDADGHLVELCTPLP